MKRDVRWVTVDDDLLAAARVMRDHDIGFLPVCDGHGVAVGILTDRDIVIRACAEDALASATTVGSVMTRGVTACRPGDSLAFAEAAMREHRVTRVVVVDDRGAPVGVLSLSDVAQYERPVKVGETLRTVAQRKYAPERP